MIGLAVVTRILKRYPIVGVSLVVWRWWRRRSRRIERTSVKLLKDESITLQRRRAN